MKTREVPSDSLSETLLRSALYPPTSRKRKKTKQKKRKEKAFYSLKYLELEERGYDSKKSPGIHHSAL